MLAACRHDDLSQQASVSAQLSLDQQKELESQLRESARALELNTSQLDELRSTAVDEQTKYKVE